MKANYDFSKSIKNPYINKLKKQVTIRLENDTIDCFKSIAADADVPYQKLIKLFLRDCSGNHKKPEIRLVFSCYTSM
jgi:predicted DNA binding CopG/RHH family protein